ncbi:M17 family metallopeptidase [Virgibacillus siamensis]|uniref:M17 family metallopeptidase n=1 Tax=Virgibacillus siamensis TaxID=480071 RepID=UPI0009842BCC|nr:leucyl aminopeptidase family protein [Virgibacillus siamensis]
MVKTSIVFSTDDKIKDSAIVSEQVHNSMNSYSIIFLDNEMLVAIKAPGASNQSYDQVRMTAGDIARSLRKQKIEKAVVHASRLTKAFDELNAGDVLTAFVEGWELGAYQFLRYKSDQESFKTELQVLEGKQTFVEAGKIRAAAMAFSRDVTNEIPSALSPSTFPSIIQKEFDGTDVEVNVLDKAEIVNRKMNGVLTVCRGSIHEPSFVELMYRGDETKPLIALVGKGVTFDSGGITLKRGKDISGMRMDMGGSAAVLGAMKLLSESNADVNVVALIPIVENMPDRKAVIPGDVIHYKNGLNVQVGNTDAEGRLILADGLIRAGELEASYVVDIATLTGSIGNALGSKLAGVFGDVDLSRKMHEIGRKNGDFNWPMPLVDAYDNYLDSDYADFNNTSGKGEAGSIVAALFLRRFVPENCRWLHIDMAGVMASQENGYYSKAASGFGARLLADYTVDVSK